eukprot:g4291.t1
MTSVVYFFTFLALVTVISAYKNVNGEDLARCSTKGMALTGYTRSGSCVDQNDDAGSHHICINLASTNGGNFCTVTGQPNWCGSSMRCNDGTGQCPVRNWCVCQWAFASYIQKAGGCDKIQDIVCSATNLEALKAYKRQASSDPKIQTALDCLQSRCLSSTPKDTVEGNDTNQKDKDEDIITTNSNPSSKSPQNDQDKEQQKDSNNDSSSSEFTLGVILASCAAGLCLLVALSIIYIRKTTRAQQVKNPNLTQEGTVGQEVEQVVKKSPIIDA